MMKAARIHNYGSSDVLTYEDAPCPERAHEEVLVRVHAAGINPVDWKTRAGSGMAFRYGTPFPLIVGWDVSGVVEAVGPNATKFKVGDEVFGMVRFPDIGSAYAEYVAAPQQHLALKPQHIDHVQAAAIPLAALTAWQALFEHADLRSGQRLLIQGAAGGVGHLAVQIAKWKGAYVIGTASSGNMAFVRSLGADEVADYTLSSVKEPVDMVLDTVGGELLNTSFEVVKDGGSLVTIAGTPDAEKAAQRQLHARGMLVHTEEAHLNQIADLMSAGVLKTEIAQVFPLAEAQKAQQLGESRILRRGKLVLTV